MTCTPSTSLCATLHGVAPNTSVRISASRGPGPESLLQQRAGLRLDLLRRQLRRDVEGHDPLRRLRKGMAGGGPRADASGACAMMKSPAMPRRV